MPEVTPERAKDDATPRNTRPPTDLRRHRGDTERRLVIGGVALALVVGGGLIWYFWDLGAMLSSWLCLGSVVLPIAAIYLALKLFERWGNSRSDE